LHGDSLVGNHGDDIIYGGEGEDTLDDGTGEDLLYGGDGDDRSSSGKTGPGTVSIAGMAMTLTSRRRP
jgi:Ca2+-binding RTX toxin-like protein